MKDEGVHQRSEDKRFCVSFSPLLYSIQPVGLILGTGKLSSLRANQDAFWNTCVTRDQIKLGFNMGAWIRYCRCDVLDFHVLKPEIPSEPMNVIINLVLKVFCSLWAQSCSISSTEGFTTKRTLPEHLSRATSQFLKVLNPIEH